jgi:predicted RNase H-like nuclease (RuvC/YqgF family)
VEILGGAMNEDESMREAEKIQESESGFCNHYEGLVKRLEADKDKLKEKLECLNHNYRILDEKREIGIDYATKTIQSLEQRLSQAEAEKNVLANVIDNIREKALVGHAHPDMTDIEMLAYNALQKLEWGKQ